MKKTISMILIALVGVAGLTVTAQTPADNEPTRGRQPIPQNKMRQPREFTEFAFEGILLDIDQQTRIDSLNAAVAPTHCDESVCPQAQNCGKDGKKCDKAKDGKKCDKAKDGKKCDKAKDGKKCERADKQCPDSAACPMRDGKGRMVRQPRQNPYGADYRAKVKEILTPDQYVVFLENIVAMSDQQPVLRSDRGKVPAVQRDRKMPSHDNGRQPMQPRKR